MKITETWHGATCFVTIQRSSEETDIQLVNAVTEYFTRYPNNPFETKVTGVSATTVHIERYNCE